MRTSNWVVVAHPRLVHVGIAKRAEFDNIALPVIDCGRTNPNRQVLTKTAYHGNNGDMTVVFEHWYGPTPVERVVGEMAAAIDSLSVAPETSVA